MFVCFLTVIYREEDDEYGGVRAARKCLMKNGKTMYVLARATAVERGPRKFKRIVGYALTEHELKRIFVLEGFNPQKKTMSNYIDMWLEFGFVKAFNLGEEGEKVYFFVLDKGTPEDTSLIKKLELAYPDVSETADVGVMVI